jgi:hypothetical protein
MGMTPDAEKLWDAAYPDLTEGFEGNIGRLRARSEAQCLRLALTYALLDCTEHVEADHLHAAFEAWRCCEASALHLFGGNLDADPLADRVARKVRERPGITATELRRSESHNIGAPRWDRSIARLVRSDRVRTTTEKTAGAPITRLLARRDLISHRDPLFPIIRP